MAKGSGSKFAKGVAAVLSFGLSEAGFAVLGALNGASGAAKLFHVDEEDVEIEWLWVTLLESCYL